MRTTVLWRESRWHCACGRVASRWIAQLYLDDVTVAECAFSLVCPMLRIVQHWHVAGEEKLDRIGPWHRCAV